MNYWFEKALLSLPFTLDNPYFFKKNNPYFFPTFLWKGTWKIVSEYDQEIPQSQTADNPVTPQGRAAQPSRDTRKTN